MPHVLDHPVWNALLSGNKNVAQGDKDIRYFPKDISPLMAFRDLNQSNISDLLEKNLSPECPMFTTMREISIPAPWRTLFGIQADQMVHNGILPKAELAAELVPLTADHVDQMLALTRLTKPGPFETKTITLGNYEGIFEQGKLVAMTGQRLKVDDYIEISAVCTHPDHLGKGYAKQLLLSQISQIIHQSKTPFLHVNSKNERAIGLYERLGFSLRTKIFFYSIEKAKA